MDLVTLSLDTMIWLSVAIFFASVISSATGMAGGVLMFASMSQAIALQPLIAIHGVIQAFSNAARCLLLRDSIVWRMCIPFGIGATIGIAATTFFLIQYISETVALATLLFLLLYTLFKPKKLPSIKLAPNQFIGVGLLTGSLGIVAGAIDPLLGAFFIRDDLDKEQIVATKSMMQLMTHLLKIPAVIALGFVFSAHLPMMLFFSSIAILGTYVGVVLLKKVSPNVFFILMKCALFLAAIRIGYQLVIGSSL
ncbi:sulfite exporter TauE/SafE family protein [Pseudocolwellia agarivorans]|uniref:sulfite exporter TauE/SafE family protein n=1 Tax=Pseudocolwellia agarivorans TaxID=1911682 RepID=UPI000985B106|nr:sulfite exporter TauE/SafE family protein [Pseudocolwellia agarivorans]